jgi:phospholysine phosphohistidine inorganic pyrophosphate phosphatase
MKGARSEVPGVRVNQRLEGVRALLVDLEGTVYEAGRAVQGAAEALADLEARVLRHCFVTNTTSRPRSKIASELAAMGIPADPGRIFTAPLAARQYLLDRGMTRCHLMVAPAVLEDLAGIEYTEKDPQAVVVGDVGEGFSFAAMNRAFRLLLDGVPLVTLARNRYYLASEGLILDQGPFVAALEYASRREAILVGKPSPEFFRPALDLLGVPASAAAIVGDDLEVDVGGGQAVGLAGILVRTGKFRSEELARSGLRPDAILDSLAGITGLI